MASLAGTSGRFEPELVASLNRNKWQVWPEYAARDLFGNLALFILVMVLFALIFPDIVVFQYDVMSGNTMNSLAGIAWIALVGPMTGTIAVYIYLVIGSLKYPLRIKQYFGFQRIYEKMKGDIDKLYSEYFSDYPELGFSKELLPIHKVNRLCNYCRTWNPVGYIDVYRSYMFASLYRQGVIYSILAIYLSYVQGKQYYIQIIAIIVFLYFCISRAIKSSVNAEMTYIIASLKSREDEQHV